MKSTIAILLALTLQSIFVVSSAKAQSVAIGHATAEVVESVSVSSQAVTSFAVGNTSEAFGDNLNLGEIRVNSGSSVACNVVIKPATLSSSNGSSFTMEPTAGSSVQADSQRTDGNRTIQLTASANTVQGQASGLYQGSYTIVFAYN